MLSIDLYHLFNLSINNTELSICESDEELTGVDVFTQRNICNYLPGESSTAAVNRAISSSDICIRLRLLAKSNTAFTRSSQPTGREKI